MKYYLLILLKFNNGDKDSIAVNTYEDKDLLLGNFYQQIGNWIKNSTSKHIMAKAMDENGMEYQSFTWNREEVEDEENKEV